MRAEWSQRPRNVFFPSGWLFDGLHGVSEIHYQFQLVFVSPTAVINHTHSLFLSKTHTYTHTHSLSHTHTHTPKSHRLFTPGLNMRLGRFDHTWTASQITTCDTISPHTHIS